MGEELIVVDGAKLCCTLGTGNSLLHATKTPSIHIERKNIATIQDHIPIFNVLPFPVCKKSRATNGPGPCVPELPLPWQNDIASGVIVSPFIADPSAANGLLHCLVGGVIAITDPGQSTVTVDRAKLFIEQSLAYRDALAELAELEREAEEQKEEARKIARDLGIDLAATLDPTGLGDAGLAIKNLIEGDFIEAGLSGISAIPFGDILGKSAKAARAAKRLDKLRSMMSASRGKIAAAKSKANKLASETRRILKDERGELDLGAFTRRARTPQHVVDNALREGFTTRRMKFGENTFQLDHSGMKHILQRHHPKYHDGSVKQAQTFFDPDMNIKEVSDVAENIMRQNRETLVRQGATGMYQISGTHKGRKYTIGVNKGRVGQFYPH
jgi:hypothetical protein